MIEKILRLTEHLNKKFGDKVKVFNNDIMKFSYKDFYDKKLTIFGNLPYNVSTQILTRWIKMDNLSSFLKNLYLCFKKKLQIELLLKQIQKIMEGYQ